MQSPAFCPSSLRRLAVLPLLFLLAVLPCTGQEPAKVTVRSAIFPGTGIEDSLTLHVGEGREGLEVPVWGGKFSPEFELPRQDVWRFGHWETATDAEGRSVRVFKERGKVRPPAGRRLWLVFFQAKPGEDAPLQVKAFAVDQGSLKEGGCVVLNFSSGPIAAQIGDKKTKINSGRQVVVEPGSRRGQSYPVKFLFPHEGQLRPFVTTNWFHGERRRRLAMVVQADENSPPKLLTIDDIAAKEDEPE